jgi:non-specific serine/threonine protein kinase
MLGLLMALVDKSLVVYEDGGSEARYRLLETFRQYAAERLAEVGESVIYRARHRDYYLSRAQDAVSKLNGPEHDRWMSEIEAEFDNLREALGFCLADPDSGAQGLLLAVALNPIWQRRGFAGEGREKLAAAQAHASLGQIAGPPS